MAPSQYYAEELRRGLRFRCDEFGGVVQGLRGPLGAARQSLRAALDLVADLPPAIMTVADHEWERNVDATSRVQILTVFLNHLNDVASFTEAHLAHGARHELSEGLADEVASELLALGLSDYQVIISHGGADNFETKWGDIKNYLFGLLKTPSVVPATRDVFFALFKVPRIEGTRVQWRPVLLGHEVAHVPVAELDAIAAFDLITKLDLQRASNLANPLAPDADPTVTALGLHRIGDAWVKELLCDVHALVRYGPAAVAALGDYFASINAMVALNPTHPPGVLRMKVLLDLLGPVANPRLAAILRPWEDFVPPTISLPQPWAQYLADLILESAPDLLAVVSGFPTTAYLTDQQSEVVDAVANCIATGMPGLEVVESPDGSYRAPQDADVVNAVWVSRVEETPFPFDRLGRKTIESLDFVTRWVANGGTVPIDLLTAGAEVEPAASGALTEASIEMRLRARDEQRLVVTPLLQRPKGAALDLRLGKRFIVFRRTSAASFDPLGLDDDPREIQTHMELSWTETLVLHPHEMVLGCTLEYLVLPRDLSAQVITRSSYGRLGLLSATAVQVHPGFRGCLTMELVNLSSLPIELTTGERIAQLVLLPTTPARANDGHDKYDLPIGPEFSRVREDPEAGVLRQLRSRHHP